MDTLVTAARLQANITVFEGLLAGVEAEQARWKPSPEEWSVLEVVNHLADEEAGDFRGRLDLTLHRPGEAWPQIDPQGWVLERRYNERALRESLARFLDERARSVAWLQTLTAPDWGRAHEHPRGPILAGDLAASWLDHDLIHIRQLTRLHHQWLVQRSEPYSTGYAGGF